MIASTESSSRAKSELKHEERNVTRDDDLIAILLHDVKYIQHTKLNLQTCTLTHRFAEEM